MVNIDESLEVYIFVDVWHQLMSKLRVDRHFYGTGDEDNNIWCV